MKKYFEIFLVISILSLIIYIFLYIFYFDFFCNKYSWKNELNLSFSIKKIANCKDSLICYPRDIKTNWKNEVNNWNCEKKPSPIFWEDLYKNVFNNFKNSIIK
jgi:hypothetical protein